MATRATYKFAIVPLLGLAVLALLQAITTPWNAGFWGGDAARHALNGALVHDWIASLHWRRPVAFATQYYLHYPAITIALYPPLVPVILAAVYAVLGVSQPAALSMIFAFSLLALASTYSIARLALPPWQSLAAAALLAAMPQFADLSRQVMLEIPAIALSLAGAACLLRTLRSGGSRSLWAGILLGVAAAYAKQPAAFALLVWPLLFLWEQRGRALRDKKLFAAALAGLLALIPLAVYTVTIGRWSLGTIVEGASRDAGSGPLFYIQSMPGVAGWAISLPAAACILIAPFLKWSTKETLLLRWGALSTLVTLAVMTSIVHKEPRYGIFIAAPLPILAILLLNRAASAWKSKTILPAAAATAFGAGTLAWCLFTQTAPRIGGYAAVADYIAQHTRPGEIVMFEGLRVHNFAFALRAADPRAPLGGPLILRPVKFLVNYVGERELGVTDRHLAEADIASLIDKYSVRLVILQPGFWTDLPSVAAFEHYVCGPRFRLAATYNISGNLDRNEAHDIEVWENKSPAATPPARIEFDMPMLGGRIENGIPPN